MDLRQTAFFYKDMAVFDARFDVNKDVVDGCLVNEMNSSSEEEADKVVATEDADPMDDGTLVEMDVDLIV